MKWVLKDGEWKQQASWWEEAVISLGWLCGFVWHRIIVKTGHFFYNWIDTTRSHDPCHSRAAAILLALVIFFGSLCIHS